MTAPNQPKHAASLAAFTGAQKNNNKL